MIQPRLFEVPDETVAIEDVILYALGDFQSRGKVLANRELALDRLRGAFVRTFRKFKIPDLTDERVIEALNNLGARVVTLPSFVAKHPYRVTIPDNVVIMAVNFYTKSQ
ncbi:MAG: hypothetical protein WKF92_02735 [Pyrinomonadaceae bacterium]